MALFAFIGCLSYFDFDTIDEVAGSSAGSLIGFFICSGKTSEEITDFCLNTELSELTKISLSSLVSKFGLISYDALKKHLRSFCGNPTFKELSKKLYISSYCVNRYTTEYFSVDTHPDMHVIDAVCMSMAIPLLFETVRYNNFTYLDGGTVERLPCAFLNRDPKDVVIICLESEVKHMTEIKTFRDFITSIINIILKSRPISKTLFKEIRINLGDTNVFDFSIKYDDKLKLYTEGYQHALIHSGSAI